MTLPRSMDDLRGLRAARWIRESTAGQLDRFGPASQHEQIDRFVERTGLVDSGLVFTVAHSGRYVWRHERMGEMLRAARAGGFDLLLTGYADRWQRNLRRFLELIEDDLHPAGVALVMCDRRLLSADPNDWHDMIAEAHAAQKYSDVLSERVRDGLERRFVAHADQWGRPPLGFRRTGGSPSLLEVDPATIGAAARLFERYASGIVSQAQLALEAGLAETAVKEILRNPLYNGRARRRRRSADTIEVPTPWRSDPPVPDALWRRCEEVRALNRRGGGPASPSGRIDLLKRLVFCVCGRHVRADGQFGDGQHRRIHLDPCAAWGPRQRRPSATWERKLAAQLGGIRLEQRTEQRIAAALSAPPDQPRPIRRDTQRRRRHVALEHAAGRISDAEYLAAVRALREAPPVAAAEPAIPASWVMAKLRDLAAAWAAAVDDREAQAELLRSIYARVEVAGDEIEQVHLTEDARRLGLDEALPERVRCGLACPRGLSSAGAHHWHAVRIAGRRRSRRSA